MSTAQKVILAVMLIVVFWDLSDSLTCYSCTFCNTPSGNVTCGADEKSCYTDNTVVFGRNITWRGCSEKSANETCETKLEKWGYKGITTCRCLGDGCNSEVFSYAPVSAAISMSSLLMLLLVGSFFN